MHFSTDANGYEYFATLLVQCREKMKLDSQGAEHLFWSRCWLHKESDMGILKKDIV